MKYVYGNWKMYLDHAQATELAGNLADVNIPTGVDVAVFPSMLSFASVSGQLADANISVGSQKVYWESAGAYTGAVNAEMVLASGGTHTLVGHSERRHVFGDTNEHVRKQLDAALSAGLVAVLCIGETAEDLERGERELRLQEQLRSALEGREIVDGKLIVAYEPVWAIGTGNPCLPDDADDIHGLLRSEIAQYTDLTIPLLYGGSVKADSVVSYLEKDTIDGVLVGSASVDVDQFTRMISAAA